MKRTTIFAMLAIFGLLVVAGQSFALTTAGDPISNTASVVYDVNGSTQPAVTSNFDTNGDGVGDTAGATIFTVDRKVDLTVTRTDGAEVSGAVGSTNAINFTVANDSNEALRFALSAANETIANPFGGNADTVDAQSFTYDYSADNGTSWTTGVTAIPSIPAETSYLVRVQTVFPATAANGAVGVIVLTATATELGGGALSDSASNAYNAKDTVLADAAGDTDNARDAAHSDSSAFEISSAVLSVAKSSVVLDDGINSDGSGGTGDDAIEYAIPGAIVEYTITITNSGAQAATDITVSDDLDTEITNGTIAFNSGSISVEAPNLYAGVQTTLTNVGDADEGDWNVTNTNTVTVSGISLNGTETATVRFEVVIQ